MSTAAYFKAAIPEPFTIRGQRLRPFSLGHYIILSRFDCAFVSETEANATMDDLVFGVLVCSMRYQEFLDWVQKPNFLSDVQEWGSKIGVFDRKEKALAFKAYIDQGLEPPKFWIEEDDQKRTGAHWSQTVATTLTGQLGYSEEQAMDGPLAKSLSDFYKHAENNGVIRLMTEDEIAEQAELEKVVPVGS